MFNIDNEMLNLDFGAIYAGDSTKFRLWSPTSDSISLSLFEDGNYGDAYEVHPMERLGNGIWEVDINGNLDGVYYTYLIRSGIAYTKWSTLMLGRSALMECVAW